VFDASYLVLGLGDVYLGAPVATPLDPRHRLVTTKYNPARTWTPENAVGIGGAYLCIYGMEGPGGYQFVGRTLQVWNTWRSTRDSRPASRLLRFFDLVRFRGLRRRCCAARGVPPGRAGLDIRRDVPP
jgi:urea carboxylase